MPLPLGMYAIGGLALISVLAGGWGWIEHQGKQIAQIEAAQEKEANRVNQETIKNLNAANELAWKNTVDLQNKVVEIVKNQEIEDAAVTELSGSDEEVRKFLDTPVPHKLRCLYNDVKCAKGTTSPDAH